MHSFFQFDILFFCVESSHSISIPCSDRTDQWDNEKLFPYKAGKHWLTPPYFLLNTTSGCLQQVREAHNTQSRNGVQWSDFTQKNQRSEKRTSLPKVRAQFTSNSTPRVMCPNSLNKLKPKTL